MFFSGRVSCHDQCKYSNYGFPEELLCLKFKIFPGCALLVITFFMWCSFSQLSPAQFPCVVLLDPECMTSSCTSSRHPCHQVCDFLAQDQLSDTWCDEAFACPQSLWLLPTARAWVSGFWYLLRSGHLDLNHHTLCSALIPCGTLETLGWQPWSRPAMGDQTNSK